MGFFHFWKQKWGQGFVTVHCSNLLCWWISERGSHKDGFLLALNLQAHSDWQCGPRKRMKNISVKRTYAALRTIKHIRTASSGGCRTLDTGRIYVLHLLRTFLSFDVDHLLIATSRNGEFISQCGEGSQHSWLLQSIPQAVPLPQRSAVGGFLMGHSVGHLGCLCCTYLANIPHHLSPLPAFLWRVSRAVALYSGLALSHFMQFTGGFQWFHRSFGKVIAHRASPGVSDTVSDRAVSARWAFVSLPSWVGNPTQLSQGLVFFPAYNLYSLFIFWGNACHIFGGLVLTHFRQCWKQTACYPSACSFCCAPGCFPKTRSYRWSTAASVEWAVLLCPPLVHS